VDGEGPFTISLQILWFETEKIETLKEFTCGEKGDKKFRHAYLFGELEVKTIPCRHKDDLLAILNNKFLLLSMRDEEDNDKVQVIKLDKPDQILHQCEVHPNLEWQPIVLDASQNDSSRSLFWRGTNNNHRDEDVLLDVNCDGRVQVNENEQLKNHFRDQTQHMAKRVFKPNGGDERLMNHLCVEEEDGKVSVSQTTKDFS